VFPIRAREKDLTKTTRPPVQSVPVFNSRGKSGLGVVLTIHFHLLPRLRLSETILLLALHAFLACKGKTLPIFTYGFD
jgi:hypothetical protein